MRTTKCKWRLFTHLLMDGAAIFILGLAVALAGVVAAAGVTALFNWVFG
jgi:hypothetical protein